MTKDHTTEDQPALRRRIGEAFRGDQLKPTIILLTSTPLMLVWKFYGSPSFYRQHLAAQLEFAPDTAAAVFTFLSSLVLLGLIPAMIVKFVLREPLADYGVQLGDRRRTLITILVFGPLFVLIGYLGSGDAQVAAAYPTNKDASANFGFHAITYLCFYIGWEFHFRGFLQHGLRDSMGRTNAVLVQVMASSLIHIGTPASETFGAIFGGLLWGILAFRTRSLLSGLVQHFLLGLSVDYFLCF